MKSKIAAICDNKILGEKLKLAASEFGINVSYEVQQDEFIENKLSLNTIFNSNIILFVTTKEVEEINDIERFIDREYFEVDPSFVMDDARNVILEVTSNLN